MASSSNSNFPVDLFCVNDQVCISLDHNIKVHFKLDNSIMVKNYGRDSCISVAGAQPIGATRLFSICRGGFKVHHNESGCLGIELIDDKDQDVNK